jgi:hypothetical protein
VPLAPLLRQCLLLALSGLFEQARYMSAIGEADIPRKRSTDADL